MKRLACVGIVAAIAAAGTAFGGSLHVRAVGGSVTEGHPITVTVYLDVNTTGIQAWQYGLCHDAARLEYTASAMGAGTAASQGGMAPDYADLDLYPGGLTWVVLIDFGSAFVLPVGTGFEDLVVTYTAAMLGPGDPDPTETLVSPCDRAFGVPPVAATYTIGGESYPSTLVPGTVSIAKTPSPPSFFDIRIEDVTVGEGEEIGVPIFIDTNVSGVQGWQYGICHDGHLAYVSHALGASTQALNGGAGPDFADFDVHADGETWVVLVDDKSVNTLPPGMGLEDVVVTYRAALLDPCGPDSLVVDLVPCGGVLGSPPVGAAYTVGGESYPAGLIGAKVTIAKAPIVPVFEIQAEDETVAEGDTVAVSFTIDTNVPNVEAWQYGICHGADVAYVSHALGASTQALNGGAGPDFVDFDVYAGGETWVVLIDTNSTGDRLLPPGNDLEDLVVTYRARLLDPADPDPVVVAIVPCDGVLGSPPVGAVYSVCATSRPASLVAGSIEIAKAPVPFIRGDGNTDKVLDLADAVWILNYLFRDGPSGTCLLAMDGNDDGAVDLGDPIWILSYLFTDGPPPPPPFPACGTVPGQVRSQCTAYDCP